MLLQLAVDLTNPDAVHALLEQVADQVDIIEVGTPLVIHSGVSVISGIKEAYPEKRVLADLKIMDAGAQEAALAFDAGADIVTVLGLAHEATITDALVQARRAGGRIMADLIAAPDIADGVRKLEALGVDMVCLHTAFDIQSRGVDPARDLALAQPMVNHADLVIAGGINPDTLPAVMPYAPAIVVVGGYITGHDDPRRAVRDMRRIMDARPVTGRM